MRAECIDSAMVSKECGGPLCFLDCDSSSRSLSLKVTAPGTNKSIGWERSNPYCPGVMAVPGFSPLDLRKTILFQIGSFVAFLT